MFDKGERGDSHAYRSIECLDCGRVAVVAAVEGVVPLGRRCAVCTDRYAEQLVRLRWFLAQTR